MRGSTLFLLVMLALGGSVGLLAWFGVDTPVDTAVDSVGSGSLLPENPCPSPSTTREACLWVCDDIAATCVPVDTAGGVTCYECRDRRPARCEAPTIPEEECLQTCANTCTFQYVTQSQSRCATCDSLTGCAAGLFTEERCQQACEAAGIGTCRLQPGTGTAACYQCQRGEDVCRSDQYRTMAACQENCDGSCQTAVNDCVDCRQCPAELFPTQADCNAVCGGDCVSEPADGLNCWQCEASCADRCAERGYELAQEYEATINESLKNAVCVSGVQVNLARATIGTCACSKAPQLVFNTAIPVCQNTPCGNIACGEQRSCTTGGKQVTAACRWYGWKTIGDYRYQAQIQVDLD